MDEVERYFARLEELYGGIKRARGPFLYTQRGIRLTDLYQDDGRAILGWRAGGSLTVMKRTIERGATGSYRTAEAHRLARAVAALFSDDVPSSPQTALPTHEGAVSSFNSEGTDQQGAASAANPIGEAATPAGDASGSLHTAGGHTQAGAVSSFDSEGTDQQGAASGNPSGHREPSIADKGGEPSRAASGSNPLQAAVFRAHEGGATADAAGSNQSTLEVLAFAHEEDCLSFASAIAGHTVTLWRPWCDEGTSSPAAGDHTHGGAVSSFNSECSLSQGAAGDHTQGGAQATSGGNTTGSQHTAGRANPMQEAALPAYNGGDSSGAAGGPTQAGTQATSVGDGGASAGAAGDHTQAGTQPANAGEGGASSVAAGVCHPNGQHECATHDGTGSQHTAGRANPLRRDGCVAFCPPLPWGGGVYLVAARSDVIARCSDRASFARAIVLPPPVEAACARAVWDLIAALKTRCEQQWFIWDIYTMRYWLRRGPYLYPTVGRQAYSAFCEHCLKLGVVVNPRYDGASIVPYGAQRGVLAVLRKAPFEQ